MHGTYYKSSIAYWLCEQRLTWSNNDTDWTVHCAAITNFIWPSNKPLSFSRVPQSHTNTDEKQIHVNAYNLLLFEFTSVHRKSKNAPHRHTKAHIQLYALLLRCYAARFDYYRRLSIDTIIVDKWPCPYEIQKLSKHTESIRLDNMAAFRLV